jgi:uncharacterized membrane protein YhaH (DUF805 family)
MNRKNYFKGTIQIYAIFTLLFVLSLFTTGDIDTPVKIGINLFFALIPILTAIYGIIKYKK